MTSDMKTSRSHDPDAAAAIPRADADDAVTGDATVVPVGTFAAGQSVEGRHVAATTAPQGSFAEGQADEDEARLPGAALTSERARSSHAR
jgi:hypothetical protein